jgi:hypothetical protein
MVGLPRICYTQAVEYLTFGSAVRTDVLVAIGRLKRTYLSEVAQVLDLHNFEVQRAVASLEEAGLVVTARMGTIRVAELSPQYPARDQLYALLLKLSETPRYRRRWLLRRRPRAIGKAL